MSEQVFVVNETVKFRDNRKDGWKKGDIGKVTAHLTAGGVVPFEVYVIELADGTEVWAKSSEIMAWGQLSLFD